MEDVSLDTPSPRGMENDQKYMRPSPTKIKIHETDPSKDVASSLKVGDRVDVLVEQE